MSSGQGGSQGGSGGLLGPGGCSGGLCNDQLCKTLRGAPARPAPACASRCPWCKLGLAGLASPLLLPSARRPAGFRGRKTRLSRAVPSAKRKASG